MLNNTKSLKRPMIMKLLAVESFKEKYNLEPDQMRDLLGLMGDSADNNSRNSRNW